VLRIWYIAHTRHIWLVAKRYPKSAHAERQRSTLLTDQRCRPAFRQGAWPRRAAHAARPRRTRWSN